MKASPGLQEILAEETGESADVRPASVMGDRSSADDPLLDSLVVLLRLMGRPFSGDALTAGLPLVDSRLTPGLIPRAAERAGISARLVRRPYDRISQLLLPAILVFRDGYSCVLVKKSENSATVVFPESGFGESEVSSEDLTQRYSGYAVFAKPAHNFDARTESTHVSKKGHWFWSVVRQNSGIYAHVLVASLLINLFALASPLFIMNVYDRVVPNFAVETLWVLAAGVATVFAFDLVIRTLRGYFIDQAGKRADVLLSARIFEHVLGVRMASRPPSVGAFASNLHEFDGFRDFLTSATLTTLIDVPFIFLFISIIWLVGGPLALVPLALIPVALLLGLLIQIPLRTSIQAQMRHGAQKNAMLIETLAGLETVKVLGAEGQMQRRWEQAVGFMSRHGMRARLLSQSAVNASTVLQQMAGVLVVVLGVYLIGDGELTVGALVACTILTGRAMAPLAQVAALLTRYDQSKASLKALDEVMKLPVERPAGREFLHRDAIRGDLEARKVTFRYPGQELPALEGISFHIEPGEKVAIIGRMGSGKSSLGKLLIALYEPENGSVLIDGTDSRQIDPADLRRHVGYVPQDITLFYGSVRDNIALGSPQADDAEILRVARIAGVTEFVDRHPSGFDLPVGERGELLSGGQRQSIAVARALVHNPPILIMDEPSNAMDNNTEAALKTRLSEQLQDKTLVLVTHRASMLSLVDRLIVMDGGRAVADGPKQEVLDALQSGQIKVSRN